MIKLNSLIGIMILSHILHCINYFSNVFIFLHNISRHNADKNIFFIFLTFYSHFSIIFVFIQLIIN